MSGFCGILSQDINSIDTTKFVKSINLTGNLKTKSLFSDDCFFSSSFHEEDPLKGDYLYETEDYIFLFCGDLVNFKSLPWNILIKNYLINNYEWINSLRGFFAFAIYNKTNKKLILISDQRSQMPIYYGFIENQLVFSTNLSSFTILNSSPGFNMNWLYELFYFNFPIGNTTFLEGINKLEPFTILELDFNKIISEKKYSKHLSTIDNFFKGNAAIKKCLDTFKEKVPKYYCDDRTNLFALSAGFDSRTLLSLSNKKNNIKTYTYGIEGANDLKVASSLASSLKIENQQILLEDDFKKDLPNLIYETIRISGGTQPIIRATLLYVYKKLFENKNYEKPIVISGIGGDLFRGNGGASFSIISKGVENYFKTGKIFIDGNLYSQIFKDYSPSFNIYIGGVFDKINFNFSSKDSLPMLYDCYEVNTKYFGGEVAIALSFMPLRVPYWDLDILNLAFTTQFGNLTLSGYKNSKRKLSYKKYLLQSVIMNKNQDFSKTLIKGMPINIYASNNKLFFKLAKVYIRGYARLIKGEKLIENKLEDWNYWFKNVLNNEFKNLFNDYSLINQYIKKDFINNSLKTNDIYMLNKLASTEIILRLIKNKWYL